jgi:serine/threonine protein kinase
MKIQTLVSYERIRQIGAGQGMNSTVYLAKDEQFGGEVAVKEIPKQNLRDAGITEFFHEAQKMFAAQHPRHIVPIHYAGDIPQHDAIGIAMPFYKHGSLQDRIAVQPVPLLEAVRIGLAILSGLGTLHTRGLFHFDMKPSNVLFNELDEPLVADFGQTRAAVNGQSTLPPMYRGGMPPEFYTGGIGSVQTDIYHAGVTLYRAVNGDPHFNAQKPANDYELQQRTVAGTFPRRDKFLPHVTGSLKRVIRRALGVKEFDRYDSAADMVDALAACKIEHDWATACTGGDFEWKCQRNGKPGLLVRSTSNGKLRTIEAFTTGNSLRRRNDLCLENAKEADAQKHLKKLFAELG